MLRRPHVLTRLRGCGLGSRRCRKSTVTFCCMPAHGASSSPVRLAPFPSTHSFDMFAMWMQHILPVVAPQSSVVRSAGVDALAPHRRSRAQASHPPHPPCSTDAHHGPSYPCFEVADSRVGQQLRSARATGSGRNHALGEQKPRAGETLEPHTGPGAGRALHSSDRTKGRRRKWKQPCATRLHMWQGSLEPFFKASSRQHGVRTPRSGFSATCRSGCFRFLDGALHLQLAGSRPEIF